METQTERLVQIDEGSGAPDSTTQNLPASTVQCCGPTFSEKLPDEPIRLDSLSPEQPAGPPAGYEQVPPELWPDKDGNPPQLTQKLLNHLRGKYFTVRHPRLKDCGHLLDMINEPTHRNCENCWFQFFNTHPQLVEIADQMYRTTGARAMAGLRGDKFVKMFRRYMATVIHFMKQEGRLPNESNDQERADTGSIDGQAGQAGEGSQVGSEVVSHGTQGAGISSGLVSQ